MASDEQLADIRRRIDAIDNQLLALINQRASCAQEVAEIKLEAARRDGAQSKPVFYRPEREAQVLRAIQDRNPGPLPSDYVARIFREVMSSCLALEQPLTVAYLGPPGTFSQLAARKQFGQSALPEAHSSIRTVFRQVEDRHCDFGVVPVENSTEGMVGQTLDCFLESPLQIVGEVELPIVHHLLVSGSGANQPIDLICGHEQALAQCRTWLDGHFADVPREACSSNGEAARRAQQDGGVAAIAGDLAAETYGLVALHEAIQDSAYNTTRFLVLGREAVPPSGADKSSILVSSRNRPGALLSLLRPFEDAGVSLTRIDSRPSKTEKWTYVFYIEFEGHFADKVIAQIMGELEEHSILLKRLGSFPKAPI
ncbi:P-protein [Luminiphilus syltensis NOR5-1B]|uniref:Bifunctional chorismate mutase/prephenate dehydratase n=1 Tax=Luminiphilus syltensis NOR5-1B TaxID=565045 RepID=B8KX26_9GAMM|nr:prephenate dehydratase [Luminiphilus syltensis]EED34330.1 P-protein [Luminiphilus syltensis NOR5-1B]